MSNTQSISRIFFLHFDKPYTDYPEVQDLLTQLQHYVTDYTEDEESSEEWLIFSCTIDDENFDKAGEATQALIDHPGVLEFEIEEGSLEQRGFFDLDFGGATWKGWDKHMPRLPDGKPDFEWNHKLIRFPEALEYARNADPARGYEGLDISKGPDATRVWVYQLDTGWSLHEKLIASAAYQIKRAVNFISSGAEGPNDSQDNLAKYGLPAPQKSGHGTSTAHTVIGASANNHGASAPTPYDGTEGIFKDNLSGGLFPFVKFVPLRVGKRVVLNFNQGDSPRDVYRAVKHAVKQGAHVLTMSMGAEQLFDNTKKTLAKAAKHAYDHGVIFVCAAGNSKIVDRYFGVVEPAARPHTIAAAGIEPRKYVSGNGNSEIRFYPWTKGSDGPEVDISAPSKYIYTAFASKKFPTNAFKFGGATSQATAHVAAAAAIWRHVFFQELEHPWFQELPSRIVEAFKFGLDRSRYIPDYWRPESLESGADDKLRNAIRDSKGILNVYGLVQPENGPMTYRKVHTGIA